MEGKWERGEGRGGGRGKRRLRLGAEGFRTNADGVL